MRFRKLAGLSAGALTLGMLGAPAFMAPANATVTSTATAAFSCGTGQQASTYNATITFTLGHDNGGSKLSAKFSDMPNGAPAQFVNHPGATISDTLTVTAGTTDVVLAGSHKADFIGGTQTKMPTASGTHTSRPSSISVKAFTYKVVNAAGTAVTTQNCTLPAPVAVTFADEAQLAGINGVCTVDMSASGFGGKGSYPAKLEMTATVPATATAGTKIDIPVTSTLTFGREFSDYLQTSPVKKVAGSATPALAVGAAKGTGAIQYSTWNRTLTPGSPASAIGQPVNEFVSLTGNGTVSVTPAAAGTHSAIMSGADGNASMTVTFGDAVADAPMECDLTAAKTLGSINVAAAGPSAACTKAKGDQTAATAAVTAATAKVTSADKAVAKAKAKVKKAKSKAAKKKAKAKLKKAKAKAKTAAANLATAKGAVTTADTAVKANC